jgi:hypothetical protein
MKKYEIACPRALVKTAQPVRANPRRDMSFIFVYRCIQTSSNALYDIFPMFELLLHAVRKMHQNAVFAHKSVRKM